MAGLWCDKYRPKIFSKLIYHLEEAQQLKNLVNSGDFPHLIFHGPSGAGKRTLIGCVLRELYGPSCERLRLEHLEFSTPSKKKIEISTVASNYHIIVTPSDAGIYDRIIVQEIIKTIANTNQIDNNKQGSFKVIMLDEVDALTKDAQHALRRTMEKCTSVCRLILCCNSISRVISALRSRAVCIRVSAPRNFEIIETLTDICKKEGLSLPEGLANRIVEKCNRNMRRAILMMEACHVKQYPFTANQEVKQPEWMMFIQATASMIVQEQSPARLLQVRERLYELLGNLIPCPIIFKELLNSLTSNCDEQLKPVIAEVAADCEHRCRLGQKWIFHLEEFVVKFMYLYKEFIDENLNKLCCS